MSAYTHKRSGVNLRQKWKKEKETRERACELHGCKLVKASSGHRENGWFREGSILDKLQGSIFSPGDRRQRSTKTYNERPGSSAAEENRRKNDGWGERSWHYRAHKYSLYTGRVRRWMSLNRWVSYWSPWRHFVNVWECCWSRECTTGFRQH